MVMQKAVLLVLLAGAAEAIFGPNKGQAAAVADSAPAPPAADAASGDYPQLPAVSAMLGTASETLRTINVQTDSLEKRMMEAQQQNQAKMARQKEIFEQKLKGQEESNRGVVAANAQISKEIGTLKDGNTGLRKRAKELRDGNKLMRDELGELQNKLGVARSFIASSLSSTDDSHAKDLEVLDSNSLPAPAMPASSPGLRHRRAQEGDDDKDDDEDDTEDDGDSFLALSSKVRHVAGVPDDEEPQVADALAAASAQPKPASPRDLLQVLSRGIENLSQEEKASEAKLRSLFLQQYQQGARRHAALIAQQKMLMAQRAQLKALQGRLHIAVAHLEDSKARLSQRLRGLGLFIQKLSHLALAPAGEAGRLMETLPAAVTIPDADKQ